MFCAKVCAHKTFKIYYSVCGDDLIRKQLENSTIGDLE